MRFRGGGIGHKNTWNANASMMTDRAVVPAADSDEIGEIPATADIIDEGEDGVEVPEEDIEEALDAQEDYGYVGDEDQVGDEDHVDEDGDDEDELDYGDNNEHNEDGLDDAALGPEDGEDDINDDAEGFAPL